MAIKITFRKELNVDLNKYYESFPKSLRQEIDDAMFKLLGGDAPKSGRVGGSSRDNEVVRVTTLRPMVGTKLCVAYDELVRKEFKEGTYGSARTIVKKVSGDSSTFSNMLRHGCLEVVTKK